MGEFIKPGTSSHLLLPSQVNPSFFENRANSNPEKDPNWKLRVQLPGGIQEYIGVNWEAISRFGRVVSAVVTNDDGIPQFDRPRYEEAPNVNVVAWGKNNNTGEIMIGMISQPRPHADNKREPQDTNDVIFESIPVGFTEKIVGEDQLDAFESKEIAATREVGEETGATIIKSIISPQIPFHYPNPTFIGTTSDLVFIEVDLERIGQMKEDRSEPIFTAEYRPLSMVLQDILKGQSELGLMRMATTNSALLIFLTTLPEFAHAIENKKILTKHVENNKKMKQNNSQEYRDIKMKEFALRDPYGYADYEDRQTRRRNT